MDTKPPVWSDEQLSAEIGRLGIGPVRLDHNSVPSELRQIAHYAEWWGALTEEAERNKLVDRASIEAVRNLYEVFSNYETALMGWLNGPEANAEREPSRAYIAFSCVLMAALYGKLRLGA